MSASIDRAALVRAALRRLVAANGFHGASMGAVAAEAGVATGTTYVHYASKDDLIVAAYVEAKHELSRAAGERVDAGAAPDERFQQMWLGVHDHLAEDPDRARFLLQVESSPYAQRAHTMALEDRDDPLIHQATAPDMKPLLAPLPLLVLYDLALGPIVRLVASGGTLTRPKQRVLATACWRAITR